MINDMFQFLPQYENGPQINSVLEACPFVHYWNNNAITNMPMLFSLFWFNFQNLASTTIIPKVI